MPGRTPQEAQEAFLEPLRTAISCIGQAKITASRPAADRDLAWTLNSGEGMVFTDGLHFEASMQYRILREDRQWRVTTLAYRYRLGRAGIDLFRMHWHPRGQSPFRTPHLHLNLDGQDFTDGALEKHYPSGRMTLEDAIEWAILAGVRPARDDWQHLLAESREIHIRYRTWDREPPQP